MIREQALYDLGPVAWLMLMGIVVALGPLVWVLWRNCGGGTLVRLQALTVLTLFLTFDLVLFGAFTRLTDSGLGCPDWPGCYGNASPAGAHAEISAAQLAQPTGPVTHGKAWVEMVHRYLATGVGVLIIVLTVLTWTGWRRARRAGQGAPAVHPGWPLATLVWVCLQGAFGAWTVTWKLFPAIVTAHLIGGLVLLALLCAQAVRYRLAAGLAPAVLGRGLRMGLWTVAAMVAVQVALGGWVSTNYAVLACAEFPTCQGSWWPRMDFHQGFTVWRHLGLQPDGSAIHFEALTAIHYVHRLFAYAVFAALGLLAWRLHRAGVRARQGAGDGRLLVRQARWLAGLALWQAASGLSNVVLGWPLPAAVAHTGGAAALVVVLTWALAASRAADAVQPRRMPAPSLSRFPVP
ncbi:COX15/CtaA family protein [Xylophilus sp.]|uniref:COX15/CtaA family protein n=1 Tax=Xylophilus sp. TaxID=2653893 RepID=UPI0013B94F0D|nr:COX15/CtaA family protein [Xylophilus sp.]KAF1048526.1 MAG: Heme A synthase [Xylophilus sp.]